MLPPLSLTAYRRTWPIRPIVMNMQRLKVAAELIAVMQVLPGLCPGSSSRIDPERRRLFLLMAISRGGRSPVREVGGALSLTRCRSVSAASAAIAGLRNAGRRARHRHHGQADRRRPSAGGRGDDPRGDRQLQQRHGIFQHLWRQPGFLRRSACRSRRHQATTCAATH